MVESSGKILTPSANDPVHYVLEVNMLLLKIIMFL